ncbi:hypothetical protein BBJ28_00003533 [Nothophytophthora sp. Chile5]|nr:hypothetical protein BBJ28_00003533 [Nothophytophthora sp. Chile5]
MQLEAGLRKHDDGKDRNSPMRRGGGWSGAMMGANSYERWVKLIALGSFGLWMLFVLFYWRGSMAPAASSGAAAKRAAEQAKDFNLEPSIEGGFPEETNFLAFGDYGTGDESQRKVAKALEEFASTLDPPLAFVIGNHDCEGSIDAMLQYAEQKQSVWFMPRRYYTIDRPVAPKTILRLVVIDACDLVCGHEPRDERCNGRMNEQSSVATRKEQYEWIEQILSAGKPAGVDQMWTIVMGHWGVYSYAGNADTPELIDVLDPLLKKYRVHAYFNGHDHCMQHIRKVDADGWTRNYFISGAGGYRIHELQPKARAKPDLVHAAMTHGFMSVHMTKTLFRVQLVDDTGEILYTTDVQHD